MQNKMLKPNRPPERRARISTGIALLERKVVPPQFDPEQFLSSAGVGKGWSP